MSEVRDSARWLAGQLTANRDAVKALSAPQLGTSSIEAGAIEEYDVDGTLVSVMGEQFDGTHVAVTLAGPVPPEPVAPTVTPGINSAEVRWNGKFADDVLSPMDFSHVAVHASQLESFDPDNTTQRATITGESGDTATIMLDSGEWYFLLVAVSKAGKWSDPSDTVLAEVSDNVLSDIQDTLTQFDTDLTGVQTSVNGKSTITNSTVDADPGTPGGADGDRWQKWSTLADGGKLLATWRWDGAQWIPEAIDPSYLPKVDIGQGTFGSLDGGRMKAGSIQAKALALMGENMMPNGFGEAGSNANWSAWVYDAADKPQGAAGSFTTNRQTALYLANDYPAPIVKGGTWYILEGWVKASVAGSRIYIESMESGGVDPAPKYVLANYEVPTVWTRFSVPVKTDAGNTNMSFRMFANHVNGTVTNAVQKIGGLYYREMNAGRFIAEGEVTGTKLSGDAINGKTITGATVQTKEAGARVVMDDTGLNGWDADNINYLKADASGLHIRGIVDVIGSTFDDAGDPYEVRGTLGTVDVETNYGTAARPSLDFTTDLFGSTARAWVYSPEGRSVEIFAAQDAVGGSSASIYERGFSLGFGDESTGYGDATGVYRETTIAGHAGGFEFRFHDDKTGARSSIVADGAGDIDINTTGKVRINGVKRAADSHWASLSTQSSVPSGSYWGPGSPAYSTTLTTDTGLVTWSAADTLKFRDAGLYAVSVAVRFTAGMNSGGSPVPFVSIEPPSGQTGVNSIAHAKGPIGIGDSQGTASAPNLKVAAGDTIKFVTFQNTGSAQTAYWRISVTRIG